MQPRTTCAKTRTAWVAALVCLLAQPATAAEWDPSAFASLLGEAEQAYVGGAYADAGARYGTLRGMLSEAIGSEALPEEHRERARQTLLVIAYQQARCQQQTADCAAAAALYGATLEDAAVDATLRVKLHVRAAEAEVCVADQALEGDDPLAARRALDAAAAHVADASPLAESVPEDQVAELQTSLSDSLARHEALDRRRKAMFVADAENAIGAGNCAIAEAELRSLAAQGIEAAEQARLESAWGAACAPEPLETSTASGVGPLVTMGLGGALVATALVLEGVGAGTVDDFEAARTDCVTGSPRRCQTSLDLRGDLETQRLVTGALLGVGLAAVAGGALWWFLESDDADPDEPAVRLVPSISDDGDAAALSIHWSSHW